jgi:molybdopterin converting factor subunit 1
MAVYHAYVMIPSKWLFARYQMTQPRNSLVRVNLLFFASLVDVIGSRTLPLELSEGSTVEDLLTRLESEYPKIAEYRSILLTAVNQEYVESAHPVAEGDEIAIFPPVSGGATPTEGLIRTRPDGFYQVTHHPIDTHRISRELVRDQDGAITVFEGVVRDNSKGKTTRYLVYEAYEEMALAKIEEIGTLIREIWEIGAVGIAHRLGRVEIGEASVVVIVTSPHRRAAFDACHYAIDRLKKIVPIWKKEFFEDGEVWVEGQH